MSNNGLYHQRLLTLSWEKLFRAPALIKTTLSCSCRNSFFLWRDLSLDGIPWKVTCRIYIKGGYVGKTYLNKYNLYCYHNYFFFIFLSILNSNSYLNNYSDPCSGDNSLKVFRNYPYDMTCIYWLFCNKTPSLCIK